MLIQFIGNWIKTSEYIKLIESWNFEFIEIGYIVRYSLQVIARYN